MCPLWFIFTFNQGRTKEEPRNTERTPKLQKVLFLRFCSIPLPSLSISPASHAAPCSSLFISPASHAAPCSSLSISPASHAALPSLSISPASHAAPCSSLFISPASHAAPCSSLFISPASHAAPCPLLCPLSPLLYSVFTFLPPKFAHLPNFHYLCTFI